MESLWAVGRWIGESVTSLTNVLGGSAGPFLGPALAVVVPGAIAYFIMSRFTTANANSWLLLVQDGKLVKAGIGLTVYRGITQKVYCFPSTLQKVPFHANQVSREMQGVGVSGFVVWVINREGEGPFKAFKHLEGIDTGNLQAASESMRLMAESIVRSQVANLTINEVMTQRETVRSRTRESMLEVVRGWGVWLETVEITDVTILSNKLFEDLQAPFRQEMHLKAEQVRAETKQKIELAHIQTSLELAKQRANAKQDQAVYEMAQQLKESQEEEKLFLERQRIEQARLESEKQLQLAREENNAMVRLRKNELEEDATRSKLKLTTEREALIRHQQEAAQQTSLLKQEFELASRAREEKQGIQLLTERLEAEKRSLSATSVHRMLVEAVRELYANVSSVKVVNVGDHGLEGAVSRIAAILRDTTQTLPVAEA